MPRLKWNNKLYFFFWQPSTEDRIFCRMIIPKQIPIVVQNAREWSKIVWIYWVFWFVLRFEVCLLLLLVIKFVYLFKLNIPYSFFRVFDSFLVPVQTGYWATLRNTNKLVRWTASGRRLSGSTSDTSAHKSSLDQLQKKQKDWSNKNFPSKDQSESNTIGSW